MPTNGVELVKALPGPDGCEGLLAVIVWGDPPRHRDEDEVRSSVQFYTPADLTLQFARMRHPKGHVVPKHRHLRQSGRLAERTQEVLMVREGLVRLEVFDSLGNDYGDFMLRPGDAAVLVAGAHRLEVVTDAVVEEVKTGPYPGRDLDKVELP